MSEQEFKNHLLPVSPRLFRLALRLLGNEEEARDALQETYSKLWIRRMELANVDSITAYSITVIRNICIDTIRKRKIHMNTDLLTQELSDDSAEGIIRKIDHQNSMKNLSRAIEKLPETQKLIIQLRDIEGMETKEILKIIGGTEEAFRTNLSRARKAIREEIGNPQHYGYYSAEKTTGKIL